MALAKKNYTKNVSNAKEKAKKNLKKISTVCQNGRKLPKLQTHITAKNIILQQYKIVQHEQCKMLHNFRQAT